MLIKNILFAQESTYMYQLLWNWSKNFNNIFNNLFTYIARVTCADAHMRVTW